MGKLVVSLLAAICLTISVTDAWLFGGGHHHVVTNYQIGGYSHRFGDCWGHDIKHMTHTPDRHVCSRECDRRADCRTFLWVARGGASYCWLKKYSCPRLSATNNRAYHFYNKLNYHPPDYSIRGYTHRYGDCWGHDIKHMTRTPDRHVCSRECDRRADCRTFLWVARGGASYCWLKKYSCPRLSATNNHAYHFYNKIARPQPPPPPPQPPVPPAPRCPPICRMFCQNGFVTDANGCPICKCRGAGGNVNIGPPKPEVQVLPAVQPPPVNFQIGGKFPPDMFGGTCPIGSKETGNVCIIENTDQFLPWLKIHAPEYGIEYSVSPVETTYQMVD